MRTRDLVIVGAVMPLVLGGSLGMIETSDGKGTWAYPMEPTAFLLLSIGLAISHLLVLLVYVALGTRSDGLVSTFSRLGAVGSALLAGCELWSGLEARTDLDSGRLDLLDTGYIVTSGLVAVGTIGAAILLKGSPVATPLLLNGVVLVVAGLVKYLASDGWGIAALTVWSLLYIPVALRLQAPERSTVRT